MIATCHHCDFCEGEFSDRVVPAAIEHQKETGHILVLEGGVLTVHDLPKVSR